jgi:hypothetical protein
MKTRLFEKAKWHSTFVQFLYSFFREFSAILPGCLSDFEIGIFLSLRPILCNVMSVGWMLTKIGQTAWQNQSDSKNQTNFGCFV